MENVLLDAIEATDVPQALNAFHEELARGRDPWEVHLSLFPVVQGVLNPPFINPHLPKMYAIFRELTPRLEQDEIIPLVRLGIREYTRRPRLEQFCTRALGKNIPDFNEIEAALAARDRAEAAQLMAAFCAQRPLTDFTRAMLLLGSGYVKESLGHSLSCTGFILLEALQRPEADLWPVITALAHYFTEGHFDRTPSLHRPLLADEEMSEQVLRAVSGTGIINLHHAITIYAIERVSHLFDHREYAHLVGTWLDFMGDKEPDPIPLDAEPDGAPGSYDEFFQVFSELDTGTAMAALIPMLASEEERPRLGRFLVKGVCDLYQGSYNPHYLTSLGSFLWIADKFTNRPEIPATALYQYLDFLFDELKE